MNQRVMQFRVGVVVLSTAIIGALLVALNTPAPMLELLGEGTYPITIDSRGAPGVTRDTPVRKNGVLVGRVADLKDTDQGVEIKVNVHDGIKLYPQHEAEVRESLLGDATIDLVLKKPIPQGEQPLPPGSTIQGDDVGNPLDALAGLESGLKDTINKLGKAGEEVEKLAANINRAIDEGAERGRISRMLDDTEAAIQHFDEAAQSVNAFFSDPTLNDLVSDGRTTMGEVREAADNISEMSNLASRNLTNLEGFTRPLGRNGEQIATSIIGALDGLGHVVEELTVLTNALNNREGTIGQLIHNPAVYDNLNRLLCNSNHVLLRINDLTKRLQIVVEDARVFMDKIAREPGRLIGGALNRGPGIK